MTKQQTASTAAAREQAHIDRRAPVTVVPQLIKADRKGKRPQKGMAA